MSPSPPLSENLLRPPPWQQALAQAVRTLPELAELLEVPLASLGAYQPEQGEFPLLVPRGYLERMRKGDPHDPLLRQVLPLAAERVAVPGFVPDPLGEALIARHGLIRKYAQRALLIATGACPVHCRYCFRRAFPYQDQLASRADWSQALEALAGMGDVKEVILSGGDPLSLSNRRLSILFSALERIETLTCVRIHSRFPIMLPERIDPGLTGLLRDAALRTVVVVHANHPNEIGSSVTAGLDALRRCGTLLLNQSVLLSGVNDDASVLAALSERLFMSGVLPYYLHLLDPVAGAAHYEVGAERGRALVSALRERLPGYLVPRLVREIPGQLSKTPL